MHLGTACFSLYNTAAPEQLAYLLQDAGNPLRVTERAFLPAVRKAMGTSAAASSASRSSPSSGRPRATS